jgi:hypothetical protein
MKTIIRKSAALSFIAARRERSEATANALLAEQAERAISIAALGMQEPSGECCSQCGELDCSNVFPIGPLCEGFPSA